MAYITKKSDDGGSKAKEKYIAKSDIKLRAEPKYIKRKKYKKIITKGDQPTTYITIKKKYITKKKYGSTDLLKD